MWPRRRRDSLAGKAVEHTVADTVEDVLWVLLALAEAGRWARTRLCGTWDEAGASAGGQVPGKVQVRGLDRERREELR